MKKNFIFAIMALTLVACNKNDNEPGIDNQRVPVIFSASVGTQVDTRAADQDWMENDAIGIFMVKAEQPLLSANISEEAENIGYQIKEVGSSKSFEASDAPIFYPMDNSRVDFYAYYPKGTVKTAAATPANYLYDLNVAEQANQVAIDFMYSAKVAGKKKTDKAVALAFDHKLCKVVLTVTKGAGVTFADMSALTVKVNQQNTTATFDLTDGTLKDDAGNIADIVLLKGTPDTTAETIIYEAILLPSDATDRIFEFNLNNDQNILFKWNMNKALTGGNKYAYTVKLNRTAIEVTGDITPWNDTADIEIDAK